MTREEKEKKDPRFQACFDALTKLHSEHGVENSDMAQQLRRGMVDEFLTMFDAVIRYSTYRRK